MRIMVEAEYACFTRPEFKAERVSYDVPTPGALEGMLKSIYWKPSMRYSIDKIIVFNDINFTSICKNEVKKKISQGLVKKQIKKEEADPCIYISRSDTRCQRTSLYLKNVKYGVDFHVERTGIKDEKEKDGFEGKHLSIIEKRIKHGQFFRVPCLGCSECIVRRIDLVEDFDYTKVSRGIKDKGDVDLGFMTYLVHFKDDGIPKGGIPKDGKWRKSSFSDRAETIYYRPHMINGIIDVDKYKEEVRC